MPVGTFGTRGPGRHRGLQRWSVATRVWLASLAVAFPITAVTIYFLSTGVSKDMAFADQERAGNRYQRPLETLLDAVTEHAIASVVEPPDAALQSAVERRIAAAFDALDVEQARDGERLQFTDEGLAQRKRDNASAGKVRARWERVVSSGRGNAEAHQAIVTDLRTMITHGGDTSNLILDPDLDSYYTMDVTLLAVPQTQDRIARLTVEGVKAIATPAGSPERQHLAIGAALLRESDVDRIATDIDTALNEDVNFGGTSDALQRTFRPAFANYSTSAQAFAALMDKIAAGETVSATDYVAAGNSARRASMALWTTAVDALDALLDVRTTGLRGRLLTSLLLTLVALVGSSGLVFMISRSITRPLDRVRTSLSEGAVAVATASSELAQLAGGLSSGTQSQAQALEATTERVGSIAELASANAERSRQAQQTLDALAKSIDDSRVLLNAMMQSIHELDDASERVSGIIGTINGIAFQTNLLALNAAVEAARAGEFGAGFAVVSGEVRNLAQRSAQAASETAGVIDESRKHSAKTDTEARRIVAHVEAIAAELQRTKQMIDAIATASDDQAVGVQAIAHSLSQVSSIVHETSANAEESAAASRGLALQAQSTHGLVDHLRSAIDGTHGRTATHASVAAIPAAPAVAPAPLSRAA